VGAGSISPRHRGLAQTCFHLSGKQKAQLKISMKVKKPVVISGVIFLIFGAILGFSYLVRRHWEALQKNGRLHYLYFQRKELLALMNIFQLP